MNDATTTTTSHRLVIFVGPHKSASSTVQELLVQYATGRPRYRKLKAFQEWRWPILPNSRIPPRKQWARLVYTHIENVDNIRKELQTALQETLEKYSNVVVGSEELDRFGPTPWSHRDGVGGVHQLLDWALQQRQQQQQPRASKLQVDVVVNYRTPRHSQWISIWKQLMSLEESFHKRKSMTYPEWICQRDDANGKFQDDKVWEYLDCVANPLGLTLALLESLSERTTSKSDEMIDWKVTLIDMGGVARQTLDIAHVSACHVMGVPCKDGWVKGVNRTLVVNPKSRDLEGVLPHQLDELEWLLRQRDCTYHDHLSHYEQQRRLVILYPDDLSWNHCSTADRRSRLTQSNFRNTTYLLQAMQSQFGCQQDPSSTSIGRDHINLTQMVESDLRMANAKISRERSATMPMQHHQDWIWIQLLQWAVLALFFAGLVQIRKQRRR